MKFNTNSIHSVQGKESFTFNKVPRIICRYRTSVCNIALWVFCQTVFSVHLRIITLLYFLSSFLPGTYVFVQHKKGFKLDTFLSEVRYWQNRLEFEDDGHEIRISCGAELESEMRRKICIKNAQSQNWESRTLFECTNPASHSQHVEGECIFRNFGIFFCHKSTKEQQNIQAQKLAII